MSDFDFYILDFIREHCTSGAGDVIIPVITRLGDAGIIWIIFTAIMLCIKKYRRIGMIMAISLILDLMLCNIVLKPLIARPRPFAMRPWIEIIIQPPGDFSFPSGHTAASFAIASALLFAKNKMWMPAMIMAVIIAYSRLYLYVHYPTDILGGIAIGFIAGFLSNVIYKKLQKM